MKKKIIFMGEKPLGVRCLTHLLTIKEAEICCVITRSETGKRWWEKPWVLDIAKKHGLKVADSQDKKLTREICQKENPDIIFSVLHPYILDKATIESAKYGAINLHGAPLPEYKGYNSVAHAIMNQEKYFGATLHYINEEIDAGDIILKGSFEIPPDATGQELYQMTEDNAVEIFKKALPSILNGTVKSHPAQRDIVSYYFKRDSLKNKKIDINWNQDKIDRFIRAVDFHPFERAYMEINGKKFYVVKNIEGTKSW